MCGSCCLCGGSGVLVLCLGRFLSIGSCGRELGGELEDFLGGDALPAGPGARPAAAGGWTAAAAAPARAGREDAAGHDRGQADAATAAAITTATDGAAAADASLAA